ncbi:hypothetical protein Hanom_Chr14g01324871 [Helianthus anomalus]
MREWYTGFAHKYVAPVLSQNSVGVLVLLIPSSQSRFLTHETSAAALATALYSASVEERDTVFCREDLQDMIFEPRYSK